MNDNGLVLFFKVMFLLKINLYFLIQLSGSFVFPASMFASRRSILNIIARANHWKPKSVTSFFTKPPTERRRSPPREDAQSPTRWGAGTLTSASAPAALSSPCSHPKAPRAPSPLEHAQSSQFRRFFLPLLLPQLPAWLTADPPLGLCSNFTPSMKLTLNNQCNPETSPQALVPLSRPHLAFFLPFTVL